MNSSCTLLANCCVNGMIYLWDFQRRKEEWVLQGHDSSVASARFSFDDKYLLTSSSSELILWDVSTWKAAAHKSWMGADFVNAEFLPGTMLGFSTAEKNLVMIDFLTMKTILSIPLNSELSEDSLAISPKSDIVCIGTWGEVIVVDLASKALKKIELADYDLFSDYNVRMTSVEKICFQSSGMHVFFITKLGAVFLYDLEIDDIVDVFYRWAPMSGADFRNATGLDTSLKKQLKLNGALV